MSNQGLLSTRPQAQRHALVKPSVPVPVQSQEPVYSSSSEDDEVPLRPIDGIEFEMPVNRIEWFDLMWLRISLFTACLLCEFSDSDITICYFPSPIL